MNLLVETAARVMLGQRARITKQFEQALESPVDIVALQRGTLGSAFARITRGRAQPAENAA